MIIHQFTRMCEGHPSSECKSGCGIDCHFNTAEVEAPHDKALRHFWEPNQALHIEAYTGPSRLHRALDWTGNQWDELNELGKICAVVCGVAVCFVAAVAAVEAMT